MESHKLALRRFALDAPNAYTKRSAREEFTRDFLACFGWEPATLPSSLAPELELVDQGDGTTRKVGLWWEERGVLIEVVEPYVDLDMSWGELAQVCVQLEPTPRFVVYTNRRQIQLYEPHVDKDQARLSIALDELAKHSASFAFLDPEWDPTLGIEVLDVDKVSRDVADSVAKVYRQIAARDDVEKQDAVRFVLQCIIAMFAEDIGLLPAESFTTLLYQAREEGDARSKIEKMFTLMNTPQSGSRDIRYFNGGLFAHIAVPELELAQLDALIEASEADWSDVDPHIFGSVFQGIMDDAERHATGAHYTTREAIMRVVGPTIVEPWRQRIDAARTLEELKQLRTELSTFRVLDPACGSGNFLYVTFRELYRLETDLLVRIHKYASGKAVGWGSGIITTNFYGIDINAFAVELARTTLNIAKKIAFDERQAAIADLYGQVELTTDPSLPLDNLQTNIVTNDALFVEWPQVDTIVGNPPFLGNRKLRGELGDEYVNKLAEHFEVGIIELSAYWFRLAHSSLPVNGRAGLVSTSSIRVGNARRHALDYLVENGATITNAVSSSPWPGEAVVNMSIVNWIKAEIEGPHRLVVGNFVYERDRIPTHLQLQVDAKDASKIKANNTDVISQGINFGHNQFELPESSRTRANKEYLRQVVSGEDLLSGSYLHKPTYKIYLGLESIEEVELSAPELFEHLKENVLPSIQVKADAEAQKKKSGQKSGSHYTKWLETWWKPIYSREAFFKKAKDLDRIIVCSRVASRSIYMFISRELLPSDGLQMFAFDDDYTFGILQSTHHWLWTRAKGGRLKSDIRYKTSVWSTFPWPQSVSRDIAANVAKNARELRATRRQLMQENNWSLRELYQASEVEGPHPLKEAQATLDASVAKAYGQPGDQGIEEFLLELNKYVSDDESEGLVIQGPGIPSNLDPTDSKFTSQDCIQPLSMSLETS